MLEARFAGFGASGRNGGWPGSRPAQAARLAQAIAEERSWGVDVTELTKEQAAERIRIDSVVAAYHTPHCARIQPARLARGLAEAVERRGVTIYEDTPVTEIDSGRAVTTRGTVRAPIILRATEGFTPRRPAPDLVTHEQLDDRHRSDPGRVVARNRLGRAGNRGGQCPWLLLCAAHRRRSHRHRLLTDVLHTILPQVRDVPIAHGWCGVLGVPRDWPAGVDLDKASGLGWAGGYVGHGVTATNLAGRTLADLVLGRETPLTELPWVGHRSRKLGARAAALARRAWALRRLQAG
ncbi:NAD(P)/FAD-dependent oxidoreductase [Mycolicibacterium fortuitum]|uniref:NAD(P)/FAD-dependent oxidoreductase n=1 Tax=Mycolicibacterium fortuitum TaxID=1766 RepID=UPI0009425EE0|nr:FAD-dependent oxidoreductase [Mycolicibacterium fortuitum]